MLSHHCDSVGMDAAGVNMYSIENTSDCECGEKIIIINLCDNMLSHHCDTAGMDAACINMYIEHFRL